jgi:hypothetical protein
MLILFQCAGNRTGTDRGSVPGKNKIEPVFQPGMRPGPIFFEKRFPQLPPDMNSIPILGYFTKGLQPIKVRKSSCRGIK